MYHSIFLRWTQNFRTESQQSWLLSKENEDKKQKNEGSNKDFMQKMTGLTGGHILPLISEFIFPCGSSVPEDLSGANSACEWLFDEKDKEFFCLNSSGSPGFS